MSSSKEEPKTKTSVKEAKISFDEATSKPPTTIEKPVVKTTQPTDKTTEYNGHYHSTFSLVVLSLLFGFLGGFLATSLLNSNGLVGSSDGSDESIRIVSAESDAVSKVAKDVSPSVVSVTVETAVSNPFFSRDFTQEGAGTGIILTEDGLILTNKHVVPEGITSVSVILSDGTKYDDVEVVDRDPLNDVAFIQIKNISGLKPAKLGDSDLVGVGNKAIAIGNALGQFSNTVTSGIISGLGRPITAGSGKDAPESLNNLFQTDASINPGNSGGPLVNINGEVIGLNTAVAGNAENIGFAIPINDIKAAISSVEAEGRIIRPYLGVRYISLTSDIAKALELSVERGAYIFANNGPAILPGSPAEAAGLKEEDVIVAVGDEQIDERNTLSTLLGRLSVGEEVVLKVQRGDENLDITVTLAEAPDVLPN